MPLEGIQTSGQLLPINNQFAEAALLGIFESKVEHNVNIKKPENNKEADSKENDTEEKSDNTAAGYYNETSSNDTNIKEENKAEVKTIQYNIRFNPAIRMIDVIDIKTKQVVQSVSPTTLLRLISELKYSSGVFVDNKI